MAAREAGLVGVQVSDGSDGILDTHISSPYSWVSMIPKDDRFVYKITGTNSTTSG